MTDAEYRQKKLDLLKRHLRDSYWSGARGAHPDEVLDSLARQLADALDRLALEIDPFAPGTGKSDTLLKAMGAPAQGGSRHGR